MGGFPPSWVFRKREGTTSVTCLFFVLESERCETYAINHIKESFVSADCDSVDADSFLDSPPHEIMLIAEATSVNVLIILENLSFMNSD